MDFFTELEKGRYGSFELKNQVGPNLLKGLLISFLLNGSVVASPYVVRLLRGAEEIPPAPKIDRYSWISHVDPQLPSFDPRRNVRIVLPTPQKRVTTVHLVPVPDDRITESDTVLSPDQRTIIDVVAAAVTDSGPAGDGSMVNILPPTNDSISESPEFIPFEVGPQSLPDFSPQPDYPELARIAHLSGRVIVAVFVDKKGDVRKWKIEKTNPAGLGFEEEVLKVVPKWKFTPALQQGSPVGVWVSIPFKFDLRK
jgi:periplasmic protein TonB